MTGGAGRAAARALALVGCGIGAVVETAVGTAWADEAHGLDLTAVAAHVESQATTAPEPKLRRVYAGLARRVTRAASQDLRRELAAIAACAKAADGKLAADPTLSDLVDAAVAAADAELGELVDPVSDAVGRVPPEGRARPERAALAARVQHVGGHALRNSRDRVGAARLFVRAAAGYAKATTAAERAARRLGEIGPALTPQPARVYTVVGTGDVGFNGDGRSARRTTLYYPEEVRFGPDGKLYFLDWNNHLLRCLDADGTIARVCGKDEPGDSEGDALSARLNHPASFVFEPTTDGTLGRVFIAAWHNHQVKVYDPSGPTPTVYTIAGGTQGYGGDGDLATRATFDLVAGILRLPNGDLLVTDASNQIVRRIALSEGASDTNLFGRTVTTGRVETLWGRRGVAGVDGDGGPAGDATFAFSRAQNAEPDGRLEMDAAGNVYIVCGAAHVVRRVSALDHTISTIAGNGTRGYSGDGGDATQAQLDTPSDVAIAPDGTVYISDSGNDVIRRVASDGTITTYAGDGTAGSAGDEGPRLGARFREPSGLELDAAGNLYVTDRLNSVVRVVTSDAPGAIRLPVAPYRLPVPSAGMPPAPGPSGTIATYAGSGALGFNGDGRPARDTQFYWPQDVTVDPATGLVIVLDWNNHRVRRVQPDGTVATIVGSGQLGDTEDYATDAKMNHPADVVFHPATGSPYDGELFVASWHTDKVLRIDGSSNRVVYMAGGARGFGGDGGQAKDALLNLPSSIRFDSAGNWYVADQSNRRIRFVDATTGVITTIVGTGQTSPLGDDGPGLSAALNLAEGTSAQISGRICLDPTEQFLYVADTDNHRIRRVDLRTPDHTITTFAGTGESGYSGDGGPARDARLASPVDVECDAEGNVFVCERDNHVVRRVDVETGTIRTFAGTGAPGAAGDAGPASAAQLRSPGGIHLDRATGRLYIADTLNSVVRVVWE